MIARRATFVLLLQILCDACATSLALLLAWLVRFHWKFLPVTKGMPDFQDYLQVFLPALGLCIAAYHAVGLYGDRASALAGRDAGGALRGSLAAGLLLAAATFFYRGYEFSRAYLLFFIPLDGALLLCSRAGLRHVLGALRRRGRLRSPAVVAGAGRLGQMLVDLVRRHPWTGFDFAGFVDPRPSRADRTIRGLPVLGDLSRLPSLAAERPGLTVFLALPYDSYSRIRDILRSLSQEVVEVFVVPDELGMLALRTRAFELGGVPILSLFDTPLSGFNTVLKRVLDLLIALTGLLVLSPLLVLIAILIRLDSPGPVFYTQERVGLDGRIFRMLKFRSMRVGAEQETGAVWAEPADPRRTRIGGWLRRLSLDELPQLVNVLAGEMSLVGPRPERPVFIREFRDRMPRYMLRHRIKAGMTGYAQVHGWRGRTSLKKRLQYDLYYIRNWSLILDLQIIFLTLFRGPGNRNAY